MKAAQFFGKGDVRVVDIPNPTPRDGEALIAVEWCGICGSDLHEYAHGPMAIPADGRPHPATKEHLPVTMGHELCGRIISAPPSSNLSPGQAVMVDPRIYCGSCSRCEGGHTHGCKTAGFKGLSGTGGGFSETVAVDAKLCYALPDSVNMSAAALIEPLAVAWHAISLCEVSDWTNKAVLILGGGPVGIAHIFTLRSLGCRKIYVSEPTALRAAQNKQVADAVFNPIQDDIGAKCRELTDQEGVDVCFDCAGIQNGFDAGMDALRYKGTYINVAAWTSPLAIPFFHFILKEITVKCSLAYNDKDFRETVDAFIAGKFKGVEAMITARIHIDDISSKGFDELLKNKDHHIKILVTPDKSKA